MRSVIWEDEDGKLHRSLVFDTDPDEAAPQGVPQDPPALNVDWSDVERQIHNDLVRRGIYSWEDIQRGQNQVTGVLLSVIRRKIIQSYRSASDEPDTNAK